MATGHSKLAYYRNDLRRKRCSFPCPICGDSVLPKDFESHCLRKHGLDPKRCCVWCLGEVKWKADEKNLYADHLLECFRRFYRLNADGDAIGDACPANKLARYLKEVKRKRRRFLCPTCGLSILPGNFETHCLENHGLDPKTCCVWCLGKVRWAAGEKNLHANHLIGCFRKFIALRRTAAVAAAVDDEPARPDDPIFTAVDPRLSSLEPLCPPREFFGHENLKEREEAFRDVFEDGERLPPEAFEQFEILDHGSRVDYFEDEGLNAAASYVRLYCESESFSDWIHVMVKAATFKSFVDAIREDGGRTKILLFSCWCDGGDGTREARYRQHRHMVVVSSPKGRFRDLVWSGVRGERPFPNFQAKGMRRVESPMHLVNTLAYLSRRESRCNFKIDGKKGPFKNKHFYIFRSLPVDYALPLSVQWEGGMRDMLYQTKYQNVSVDRLMASGTLLLRDCSWKQKIKDFYGFESGLVLPVKKCFVPASGESLSSSSRRCRLIDGGRLVFERSEESERLDDESWLRRQAEGGNCFCEAVGEHLWAFRKGDQVKLNLAMPLLKRCEELEKENRLKDDAIKRLECEIRSKDEKIASLERPPLTVNNHKTVNDITCKTINIKK